MGKKIRYAREFPGSPVVRTLGFHCCGLGSIPGWGTEILQAEAKTNKQTNKKQGKAPMNVQLPSLLP